MIIIRPRWAHTYVDLFTKQYNSVPVKGQWHSAAGKALQWPCIMDSSGLYTYRLNDQWPMLLKYSPLLSLPIW